eukprot:TRINITY_DN212_c1_g1_i3.p1 TRINITY_DN212_c1_g1~~TRINITY_DN212_c1_g1_i3.p1  ORF type:complete len:310 (+),score=61.36 TRINITY_DN212_c1_g1_i3:584-1513(+)
MSFLVDGVGVEEDGSMILGRGSSDAAYSLQAPCELCVPELAECLRKLANIELPLPLQKLIAARLGRVPSAPAVQRWIKDAIHGENMVDSFAELFPSACERFTCWDQYRNRRYENIGSRIDFILVDRPLFQDAARRGASGLDARGHPDASSAAAALAAATLGGASRPAAFIGGGLQRLEEDEYLAQFRANANSGILYTPPQLSDHVAVSLLIAQHQVSRTSVSSRDPLTQRCQPHRSAKRITDFFTRASSSSVQRLAVEKSTKVAETAPAPSGSLRTLLVEKEMPSPKRSRILIQVDSSQIGRASCRERV